MVIKKLTNRNVVSEKCSAKQRLLVNKKEHIFSLCYILSLETTGCGTKQ